MTQISASAVKALRDSTSAGMMDCKKALEACGGDAEKAVAWLREKGLAKAAKKAGRAFANRHLLDTETAASRQPCSMLHAKTAVRQPKYCWTTAPKSTRSMTITGHR